MSQKHLYCQDCETEWSTYCPFCKIEFHKNNVKVCAPFITEQPKKKQLKNIPKVKKEIPIQEYPITMDNFFINTFGVFTELENIPIGFKLFFVSKKSMYYENEERNYLIRVSDHWGYGIRFCSWLLHGYKNQTAWKWQEDYSDDMRVGIIPISELQLNPRYHNSHKELNSRHPI